MNTTRFEVKTLDSSTTDFVVGYIMYHHKIRHEDVKLSKNVQFEYACTLTYNASSVVVDSISTALHEIVGHRMSIVRVN